jgi:hypothetical protein
MVNDSVQIEQQQAATLKAQQAAQAQELQRQRQEDALPALVAGLQRQGASPEVIQQAKQDYYEQFGNNDQVAKVQAADIAAPVAALANTNAVEASALANRQKVEAADVAYGRQDEQRRLGAQDTAANTRLSSGLTLGNQKMMADYNAAIEAGKPVKPPAGWQDVGGKLAPLPGTTPHVEAVRATNANINLLNELDKYAAMAAGTGNLMAGENAQKADAQQRIVAQAIARANNPGRAPSDADIEAAKAQVPSITGISRRGKGATELGTLRDSVLNKYNSDRDPVAHYPGMTSYQAPLPAGFKVRK